MVNFLYETYLQGIMVVVFIIHFDEYNYHDSLQVHFIDLIESEIKSKVQGTFRVCSNDPNNKEIIIEYYRVRIGSSLFVSLPFSPNFNFRGLKLE